MSRARAACASCPQLADCLYTVVVQTDVAGYVGCTTPEEREAISDTVGVSVCPEDIDFLLRSAGTATAVQHARSSGCADSIRTSRSSGSPSVWAVRCPRSSDICAGPAPRISGALRTSRDRVLPTMDAVFEAFEEVVQQGGRVLVG